MRDLPFWLICALSTSTFPISNAGSAALVFLLLAVSAGVFILFRLRRRARAKSGVRLGSGLGRGGSNGMNDEAHELEHLVEEPEEEEEEDERDQKDGNRWSDGTYRQGDNNLEAEGSGSNGNGGKLEHSQEIFDVGNESDESEGKR